MVLVRGSGRSRFVAVVVAVVAGVAALVGLGLLGSAFADVAPIDGSSFVSGLSAQALPDGKTEESDWVDLTDEAHAVSVYDGVRFNVAFAVPKGTLSATSNVVRFPVKGLRFHSEDGRDVAVPSKGSVYRGAQKWAEFDFAGYDATAKQEYLTLTFTDVAVKENALTDLTDGHVWFNVDTAGVFPTGADQTVTIGAKSTPVTVNRPKVTLTKVANPDRASQTTPYNNYVWTITLRNESGIPLKNAYLFDCRIGSLDQKADYSGDCFSNANTANGKRWDNYSQSGFYGADWGDEFTLAANETKTITFTGGTSMTELANNVPDIYNMALLYDTKGVTGGVGASGPSQYAGSGYAFDARAEQVNPYYGKKDSLKIEKAQDTHETRYVNRRTGAECKYGDEGCSVQIGWTVKVTNEGEGAAAAGWSLQERGVGTWFTGEQIDEIVDSVKKSGGFTDVQWVTECDSPNSGSGSKKNRYDSTYPDMTNVYYGCPQYPATDKATVNLIGSGNITVNEPLAAGASFTFTYHTTAGAEEGDPMVGGRNCAYTADSSGTVVDQKCIGVEYGVENLSKNAVSHPYGNGKAQWHIGYRLTGEHVGKTLVLHESLPDGVDDVQLDYVDDEKEGSADVDRFDWFGYYATETGLNPTGSITTLSTVKAKVKVGGTWTNDQYVNGKWTIGRYAVKLTGERSFDIIINDAPARGYILVTPNKVDPKYVADNGLAKNGDDGYCATLKVTNTVTSDIADSLDDAKNGKYVGAFRKTAKSDEVPYTVCTTSTKRMSWGSDDFQTDQGTSKTYYIEYNNAGFRMNGGKDVTITDTFENLPGDASVSLMPVDGGSGGLKNVNISVSGSTGYLCGGPTPIINDAGVTTGSETKSCKEHVDWDPVTGVLKFTGLPDGQGIRINYRVLFNSPKTSIPALKNDFTVDASTKATGVTDGNSTNDITLIHAGGTIDANSIYVQKFGDSAYSKLPGAVFNVQKWDAAKKDWVDDAKNKDVTTSGSDGLAVVSNMDCGVAYKVWEKTAPNGYELDATPQYVMLKCVDGSGVKAAPDDYAKLGGNIVVAGATLTYNNKQKVMGELDMLKVDSKSYDSCSIDGCDGLLGGSEWTLESSDENGTPDGNVSMKIVDNGENDYTSTLDGTITVYPLDFGYYRLTETKAPNGYVANATPIVIQLQLNSWGGTTVNWVSGPDQSSVMSIYGSPTLVVANGTTPPKPKPSIAWTKVDANDATQLLPGSEWDLRDSNGKTTHVVDNGANDKDPGDGKLKVEGVEDGTYYLTETKAPTVNGKGEATDYQLDTSTRTVTVKDGTATISNTTANAIPNKPKGATGDITWSKVDAETSNLLKGSAWTLTVDGNQYTITDNGKATDANGNDAPQYDDVDKTDGNFRLKDMPEGTYHLAEATAPTGYVLGTENYTITIKHDGTVTLTTNAGRPVDGNRITNRKQTAGHGGFAPTGGTITMVTIGIMLLVILGGVIASRNLMAANRE